MPERRVKRVNNPSRETALHFTSSSVPLVILLATGRFRQLPAEISLPVALYGQQSATQPFSIPHPNENSTFSSNWPAVHSDSLRQGAMCAMWHELYSQTEQRYNTLRSYCKLRKTCELTLGYGTVSKYGTVFGGGGRERGNRTLTSNCDNTRSV